MRSSPRSATSSSTSGRTGSPRPVPRARVNVRSAAAAREIVGPSGEPASDTEPPNPQRHRARARRREPPARDRPRRAPDRAGRRRWRRFGGAAADDDPAAPEARRRRGRAAQLVAAHGIVELVVGLPLEAAGEEGPQAPLTRAWAAPIADALGLPVTFRDERLTQPSRRAAPRTDEARPVGRPADASPARRLSGAGRPRGRGDHPPGRARHTRRGRRVVPPRPQDTGDQPMTIRSGGRPGTNAPRTRTHTSPMPTRPNRFRGSSEPSPRDPERTRRPGWGGAVVGGS